MIGTSLNHYRITATIGAGGMGEVFRARDTRLNRDVAVKVLPKEFAADTDRLRRFEQEAKTLATLSHPNVLTVFDAGVHEGLPYLVSELLEGKTLREVLSSTANAALPVGKATDYALQMAHGLAAAHGKGIIHRDLKPENIFVTNDGRVKILDFGLAKLRNSSPGLRPPSPLGGERDRVRGETGNLRIDAEAPTLLESTEPGMVLGTPAYMSPEQVRGEPADHRADIFAFGCVLYEMLSGTRAFRRDTPVASMNAVLSEEPPDLALARPDTPVSLIRIVHRCLEKQPDRRFHSAHDLAFALEGVSATSAATQPSRDAQKGRHLVAGVVSVSVALTVLLVVLNPWKREPSQNPRPVQAVHRKFELHLPTPAKTLVDGEPLHPAISPDGQKIAYANADGLWLRWLNRVGPPVQLVPGERIVRPFWSPQSADVGYFDGAKLFRISIQGGRPLTLATVPELTALGGSVRGEAGAAWLTNERILFASGAGGLDEVAAHGGAVTSLWQPKPEDGETDLHEASPLPDAIGVLVVVHRKAGADTIAIRKSSGDRKIVWQEPGVNLGYPVYSRTGHLLYERSGAGIWALPFSLEKLERAGEPFRVFDEGSVPSVSDDGSLLVTSGSDPFGKRQLIWVNRTGTLATAFGPSLPGMHFPSLSPDERRVLVSAGDSINALDIWMIDLSGGALPLTRNSDGDFMPFWSKDAQQACFTRVQEDRATTLSKPVDGGGEERVLFSGRGIFSAGGKYTLMRTNAANPFSSDWRYMEAGATNTWALRLQDVFGKVSLTPRFSPDERWLAFAATASGQQSEIWVVDFPQMTQRTMVSRAGGYYPRWNANGRELFFQSLDRRAMMSARKKPDESGFEEPRKLFDLPEGIYAGAYYIPSIYDVAADGERFLMLRKADDASSTNQVAKPNVLLVENWFEEFREKK